MSGSMGDAARNRLAEELYWRMERLQPTDGRDWSQLSAHEKRFYRLSLDHVLEFTDDVHAALSEQETGKP